MTADLIQKTKWCSRTSQEISHRIGELQRWDESYRLSDIERLELAELIKYDEHLHTPVTPHSLRELAERRNK